MKDLTSLASDVLVAVLTMLGQPPLDAPRTLSIEPAQLQQRVCGRTCKVFAWYSPEGTIYLDKRLDPQRNILARGVLVHELMHHVQRMRSGHDAKDCNEWRERERAAYAVQTHWLRQQGIVHGSLMLQSRMLRCRQNHGQAHSR